MTYNNIFLIRRDIKHRRDMLKLKTETFTEDSHRFPQMPGCNYNYNYYIYIYICGRSFASWGNMVLFGMVCILLVDGFIIPCFFGGHARSMARVGQLDAQGQRPFPGGPGRWHCNKSFFLEV